MTVREVVFVDEQKNVPLAHHMDPADARSCHWVLYSSSKTEKPQPIGTIRLIIYPHPPHPEPGSRHEAPGPDDPVEDSGTFFLAPPPPYVLNRATSLHDGKEPYLKLGRLCIIKEFRGKKLADVMIQAALKWAAENANLGESGGLEWKGLVGLHAQEKAVTTWQRNGFVVDEGMETWWEAGLRMYGMFCRVDLGRK